MPGDFIDQLETITPGWLDNQLDRWSRHIDGRMRKRCVVPFETPTPLVILGWLADIVTVYAYRRLGVDQLDSQFASAEKDSDRTHAELKEAADGDIGLFDLPVKEGEGSGFDKPVTRSYSEASPFVWRDKQRTDGRAQDVNGTGRTR